MDMEVKEVELLEMGLRSGLTALIQTCGRISTATEGVVDLQRRCTVLLDMQREQPTPTGPAPAKEWTGIMKSAITAISVADERMKFWTREHRRWSELFRFRRTITKDIESTAKVISHVAGELTLFKQIHGGARRIIVRPWHQSGPSPSEDHYPRMGAPVLSRHSSGNYISPASTSSFESRAPSMDIPTADQYRAPYTKGMETIRKPRVGSPMSQNAHMFSRRRSVVSEGHTSPDEDGESRKKVGPTAAPPLPKPHRASTPPPPHEQDQIPKAQFNLQLDKLVHLLPHADRSVLAGYLKRSGQDILAVGKYLEDEKNGTIVYH